MRTVHSNASLTLFPEGNMNEGEEIEIGDPSNLFSLDSLPRFWNFKLPEFCLWSGTDVFSGLHCSGFYVRMVDRALHAHAAMHTPDSVALLKRPLYVEVSGAVLVASDALPSQGTYWSLQRLVKTFRHASGS